jgi:hypothetical protein
LQQGHQRRRAVSDEPGGDLGVEQVRRHRADGVGQHVQVLLGGVGDGDGGALEQLGQRARVDGQRIDQHEAARPGDLHQGEARVVRLLAVELGVDGVPGLVDQLSQEVVEIGLAVDPAVGHEG